MTRAWLALLPILTITACAARTTPAATVPTPAATAPTPAATAPTPAATAPIPAKNAPTPAATAPTLSRKILEVRQGLASYYGPGFHGKRTASGVPFDKTAMVAAHPTYPFGTVVRVTNLANERQVLLRVVDRGPAKGPRSEGVLIDVSSGAAASLGFVRQGRTRVRLEVLRWGE